VEIFEKGNRIFLTYRLRLWLLFIWRRWRWLMNNDLLEKYSKIKLRILINIFFSKLLHVAELSCTLVHVLDALFLLGQFFQLAFFSQFPKLKPFLVAKSFLNNLNTA